MDSSKKRDASTLGEMNEMRTKLVRIADGVIGMIDAMGHERGPIWKEVYLNASRDREAALALFDELVKHCRESNNPDAAHAMHGQTLARYLERASRANDQVIKLSEAIGAARETAERVDPDEVFGSIEEDAKRKRAVA